MTPFNAATDTVRLGPLALIYADMSGQRWERGAELVRMRELDMLGLNISLSIETRGELGARAVHQRRGDGVFIDLAQPSLHQSTDGQSVQIMVPRAVALASGLDVAELHGLVLDSPPMRMLASHVASLRDTLPFLAEEDGPRAGRMLLDMLVLAVSATGRAQAMRDAALGSTLAWRAREEIRQHLGSPSLTVANLCRRLGVSRSTLHRIFDAEGGVQAHIRNARLDVVRAALLDPANTERIGDLAERLGFSDAAHLSRLFKARFEQTPRDCRASASVEANKPSS